MAAGNGQGDLVNPNQSLFILGKLQLIISLSLIICLKPGANPT